MQLSTIWCRNTLPSALEVLSDPDLAEIGSGGNKLKIDLDWSHALTEDWDKAALFYHFPIHFSNPENCPQRTFSRSCFHPCSRMRHGPGSHSHWRTPRARAAQSPARLNSRETFASTTGLTFMPSRILCGIDAHFILAQQTEASGNQDGEEVLQTAFWKLQIFTMYSQWNVETSFPTWFVKIVQLEHSVQHEQVMLEI